MIFVVSGSIESVCGVYLYSSDDFLRIEKHL
jgi:hypothetical protein